MTDNSALKKAQKVKKDEFYTQRQDIENECKHYKEFFKGKTILCNCDDPYESNFFKFFAMKFNEYGLKKLISISYATSPVMYTQLNLFGVEENLDSASAKRKPYKVEITEVGDETGDGSIGLPDVEELLKNDKNTRTLLKGDGDFRSEECIEILKDADIVVTNPPFSLFRVYLSQLMKYNKKFLILGNQNNIAYKDVFPLLKNSVIWTGYNDGDMSFAVPDYYPPKQSRYWQDETGQKWYSLGTMCWFTNLEVKKHNEFLTLTKKYDPKKYKKFAKYDAINVDRNSDIPCDYSGVMGVPVSFFCKYCPDQFEIVELPGTAIKGIIKNKEGEISGGKTTYVRVLIRNKNPE